MSSRRRRRYDDDDDRDRSSRSQRGHGGSRGGHGGAWLVGLALVGAAAYGSSLNPTHGASHTPTRTSTVCTRYFVAGC